MNRQFAVGDRVRVTRSGHVQDQSIGTVQKTEAAGASQLVEVYVRGLPFESRRAEFSSAAMEWGVEHELEAVEQFESMTGIRVNHTGEHQQFILSECGQWGGTPDGITFESGIEVKCPESKTHLLYLSVVDAETLKETEAKYYWQIQAYMQLTGKRHWHFASYDPRFYVEHLRLHHCVIERVDDDAALMLQRIELAVAARNQIIEKLTRK